MIQLTTILTKLSEMTEKVEKSRKIMEETEALIQEANPVVKDLLAKFLKQCDNVQQDGLNYIKLEDNFYMVQVNEGIVRNYEEIPFLKIKAQ